MTENATPSIPDEDHAPFIPPLSVDYLYAHDLWNRTYDAFGRAERARMDWSYFESLTENEQLFLRRYTALVLDRYRKDLYRPECRSDAQPPNVSLPDSVRPGPPFDPQEDHDDLYSVLGRLSEIERVLDLRPYHARPHSDRLTRLEEQVDDLRDAKEGLGLERSAIDRPLSIAQLDECTAAFWSAGDDDEEDGDRWDDQPIANRVALMRPVLAAIERYRRLVATP